MAERYVLDASALLCLLNDEEGSDRVEDVLDEAIVSAVNYSEVVAKIIDRGGTLDLVAAMLDPLHLQVIAFDQVQAAKAGDLRRETREGGLSFGDRACLSLASSRQLIALTSDRAWTVLVLDVHVELLRK